MRGCCLLPVLLAAVLAPPAGAAAQDRPRLAPSRVAVPPVIDGVLDDVAWQGAPTVRGFETWSPDYGKPMTDDTEVSLAYDAENLYFAFRCFDRDPGKIKTSVNSRDRIRADDWVGINLDSFNDQQSLYTFYANALGIQMDARYAAGHEDFGFDAVWYSVGRIDAEGYVVEVRIPFKSLRYAGTEPVTMSVIFERQITRRSEMGTWPPLRPGANNFLVQTIPIDVAGIEHYTLLELLPAAIYSNQHARDAAGTLRETRDEGELSLTATYGVTSRLTLDGTINPDFSQVESDAGQIDVNLRSALFYPEKRPFFLEGNEIFSVSGPTTADPLQAIVHTRTVVDPLGGVKLSGKVSAVDTLAILYAPDDPADAPGGSPDAAQVGAARYKRSFREDSHVGGFFTTRSHGGLSNQVFGGDGALRLDGESTLGYYGFLSRTDDPATAGGGDGHAWGAEYTRDTRRLGVNAAALDISRAFRTDVGYLTRAGVTTLRAGATPRFYPRNRRVLRRLDVPISTEHTRDHAADRWESFTPLGVRAILPRRTTLAAGYRFASEIFEGEEFDTSGYSVSASSQVTRQLQLAGSFVRRRAIYYEADPFGGRSRDASLQVTYLPTDNLHLELGVLYADFDRGSDGARLYDYTIVRSRNTVQVNRHLFFRGILEYNSYRQQLFTDLLASFTYVPGTVIYAGYGAVQDRPDYLTVRRGLFFKASYLWRL
jgi:hypothetical protein